MSEGRARLSEGERAAIEAEHVMETGHGYDLGGAELADPRCAADDWPWPCDTERMRAALVAAEVDADRLAEALIVLSQGAVAMAFDKPGAGDRTAEAIEQAREALRLHSLAAYREAG